VIWAKHRNKNNIEDKTIVRAINSDGVMTWSTAKIFSASWLLEVLNCYMLLTPLEILSRYNCEPRDDQMHSVTDLEPCPKFIFNNLLVSYLLHPWQKFLVTVGLAVTFKYKEWQLLG